MAGSVAHDLNNLLQVVSARLELLACRAAEHDREIARVQAVVEKASQATQALMSFIRGTPPDQAVVDIGQVLQQTETLLDLMMPAGIAVELEPDAAVNPVQVEINGLQLALINLAINGRDAMPSGGRLVLRAENTQAIDAATGEARDYVAISVEDTGTGMAPDVAQKACEPFFTTKSKCGGTGLGLSQVRAFARQCGGDLVLQSQAGCGTTVTLLLPAWQSLVQRAPYC